MIGQNNNINLINTMKFNHSIPKFIIIRGSYGSGKHILADYIIESLNAKKIIIDTTVNDIRDMIIDSYTNTDITCYLITRGNELTLQAKNAILKISEESPDNVYIIILTSNINLMPRSIQSRAYIFSMDAYTKQDLQNFSNDTTLLEYITTPGLIKYWTDNDFDKFIKFCDNVIDILFNRSGVELLQISNKINNKSIDNVNLYYYSFVDIVHKKLYKNNTLDKDCIYNLKLQEQHAKKLISVKGIKYDSLIDTWLLKVRDILNENYS